MSVRGLILLLALQLALELYQRSRGYFSAQPSPTPSGCARSSPSMAWASGFSSRAEE